MVADFQKIKPIKQVSRQVVILMLLAMSSVVAMVFSFLGEIETLQHRNLKNSVAIALSVEQKHLNNFVHDYAFWDESYQKQIKAFDQDWITENTGLYLFETFGFNLSAAVQGNHQPVDFVVDGEFQDVALLQGLLNQLVSEIERKKFAGDLSTINFYARVNDDLYLIAAEFFQQEASGDAYPDGSYLVLGRRFDQAYLDELSKLFELPSLHLTSTPEVAHNALSLQGNNAMPVVYLEWQSPGLKDFMLKIGIFLLLIAVVTVLLIKMILQNFYSRNHLLENFEVNAEKIDSLTGLPSRQTFLTMLGLETSRAKRHRKNINLLIVMIDNFEQLQLTLGREGCGMILLSVAEAISNSLRDYDLLGRYATGEFALAVPDSDPEEAKAVAERILQQVAEIKMSAFQNRKLVLTASIGFSSLAEKESQDDMIHKAEKALKLAVDFGGNQIRYLT